MKYIKKFGNNAAYQAFADSAEYIEPHVSLAVEENELHYNKPPKKPKWIATYNDGHTESAECDGSTEIVYNEIPDKANVVSVEVGDCVTILRDMAFSHCVGLTSITIPSGITGIGTWAFAHCTSLTSITIPNSVASIGVGYFSESNGSAFSDCTSLTNITCLATTPPKLLGGFNFYNTNDCPIYVPAESVDAYKTTTNWRNYADRIQPIP